MNRTTLLQLHVALAACVALVAGGGGTSFAKAHGAKHPKKPEATKPKPPEPKPVPKPEPTVVPTEEPPPLEGVPLGDALGDEEPPEALEEPLEPIGQTPTPGKEKAKPATHGKVSSIWPQPALGPGPGGPEVLFSFDDGPDERLTPVVLDTLAKHHVHAIFFLVGRRVSGQAPGTEKRRTLVGRELADGHMIGNHTVDHAHLCAEKKEKAAWEIDENARILTDLLGFPVTFFRAPYGSHCPRIHELLDERHLHHTHWDLDAQEWKTHSVEATRGYLIGRISHLDGRAVILMHDTQYATIKALPSVLDWIDQENVRRRAAHRPEIRVLSWTDVARERLSPGVDQMLVGAEDGALDLAPALARRLLGPLAADSAPRAQVHARTP